VIDKVLRDAAKTDARASQSQQGHETVVMSARMGEHDDRTRFVVELSEPIAMRTFTLNNPNRVVIDMPSVKWHLDGPPRPAGSVPCAATVMAPSGPVIRALSSTSSQPVVVGEPMVLPPENGSGYRVYSTCFPRPKPNSTAPPAGPKTCAPAIPPPNRRLADEPAAAANADQAGDCHRSRPWRA